MIAPRPMIPKIQPKAFQPPVQSCTMPTANLSSMAQGFGYTLASMGPLAVGIVHDWTGGWNALGWIFGIIGLGAIIAGLGAGRALYVQVESEKV